MNWEVKYVYQSIFLGVYWFSVERAAGILNKLIEIAEGWIILAVVFLFSAIFITANILTEIYSIITTMQKECELNHE